MNEPTLDAMLQRLIHLERESRRRKIMVRVLMLLLGLVVILGATRSQERTPLDEIRAQRFILMDKNGKIVGLLSGDRSEVGLSLLDAAGETRIMMIVGANSEPFINLISARGKAGVTLASNAAILSDQEGRRRLSLSARGKGGPMVMLSDSTERVRMTIGLQDSGEPGILFSDKSDKTTWRAP